MCQDYRPGHVLVLNPEMLEQCGALCSVLLKKYKVKGNHFFYISDKKDREFLLTPLFTNGGDHRFPVPQEALKGAAEFLGKSFHYFKGTEPKFDQVWVASEEAIAAAAKEAGDLSSPECRNSIKKGVIPEYEYPQKIK